MTFATKKFDFGLGRAIRSNSKLMFLVNRDYSLDPLEATDKFYTGIASFEWSKAARTSASASQAYDTMVAGYTG